MADESAQVELANAYKWIGDPRLARFHLYVDGKKAGSARPLGGSFRTNVTPGSHKLRIRFWWYLSPPTQLDVVPGQTPRVTGDIPRQLTVPKSMARMGIHPLTSLTLRVEDPAKP
jgi:hypothetical protein